MGVANLSTGTQSQKSSASDVSSALNSSSEALNTSLHSMQQKLGSIENHIVNVKNILTSSSSDISSASDEYSRRTSVSGYKDGTLVAKSLRKSDTYPILQATVKMVRTTIILYPLHNSCMLA